MAQISTQTYKNNALDKSYYGLGIQYTRNIPLCRLHLERRPVQVRSHATPTHSTGVCACARDFLAKTSYNYLF